MFCSGIWRLRRLCRRSENRPSAWEAAPCPIPASVLFPNDTAVLGAGWSSGSPGENARPSVKIAGPRQRRQLVSWSLDTLLFLTLCLFSVSSLSGGLAHAGTCQWHQEANSWDPFHDRLLPINGTGTGNLPQQPRPGAAATTGPNHSLSIPSILIKTASSAKTGSGSAANTGTGSAANNNSGSAANNGNGSAIGRQETDLETDADGSGESLPPPLGSPFQDSDPTRDQASERALTSQQRAQQQQAEAKEQDLIKLLKPLPIDPKNREILTQRYPDGKIQIEREVALDDQGNYMNNGKWKMLHTDGQVMGLGRFENGQMVGLWRRVHFDNNHPWLGSAEFRGFTPPYLSSAEFRDGELDGLWVIKDRNAKKMLELTYKQGVRDGTGVWFFPNGEKRRQLSFKSNLLHGQWQEWDEQGKVVREDWFREGQRIVKDLTYFQPGLPETEQSFLEGKLELQQSDDWWNARLATYQETGKKIQSGPVRAWYSNGQKHMAGYFKDGARDGQFAWWHPSGNRKLVCNFKDGLRHGQWTAWHENGLKSFEGRYEDDVAVGTWLAWDEQGNPTDPPEGDAQRQSLAKPPFDPADPDNPDNQAEELPPSFDPDREQSDLSFPSGLDRNQVPELSEELELNGPAGAAPNRDPPPEPKPVQQEN